jgi:peptide chain release factor 2
MKTELEELEARSGEEGFWSNRAAAEKVLADIKKYRARLQPWQDLSNAANNLKDFYGLACEEKDESMEKEIILERDALSERYHELKLLELLGGELDISSAFLTIHAGAGGTEACDWVSMLYRMYMRWAEKKGFKVEIADMLEAEGGIKSVTIEIEAEYAYGLLKGEVGIHRLVRISPFDANKRRHTSFASVYVSPVIDDESEQDNRTEDLRIDTYRASGAGGQHINKTDSAVRITHLPTNIVVQCQNERSQHKNKAMAMKMLKSKLYEYYKEEQDREKEKTAHEKKDISWGNQIRSYVFQPYTMVKDHRTKAEMGNIQAVMDGELNLFIEEFLKFQWSKEDEL